METINQLAIDEIAADFVEEEIGRYDWRANWQSRSKSGDIHAQISQWLGRHGLNADPLSIIQTLDRWARKRPKRWQTA